MAKMSTEFAANALPPNNLMTVPVTQPGLTASPCVRIHTYVNWVLERAGRRGPTWGWRP